jgi:glycogen operon protein
MEYSASGLYRFSPGKALPFGAVFTPHGVNFSLFSRNATAVSLVIFDHPQATEPIDELVLDPHIHRVGDCWSVLVHNALPGILYLYRVDGPFKPKEGQRFNRNKLLIDPYATALTGNFRWDLTTALAYDPESPEKDLSFSETFDAGVMPKCIVIDDADFDWQGDRPLNYHLSDTIIYETHVRGLTANPSSGVAHPGTYRGIIEMIPYLKGLGITSLELLPIQEFDEFEYQDRTNPMTGEPLKNYWGYSTIAFFSPKGSYAADGSNGQQVNEFKEMVRELHKAGIEVLLDIVFNHTGEGNEMGYTFSLKGIDNSIYYMLSRDNPRYYMNYSGCGNTVNCNHPVVRDFITDCLRYWVLNMHVDGFRFDLGSILGRDEDGNLMPNPPTLQRIAEDPVLRNTKIIAEAWDAGGAYQVGSFPGGRWAEWNDRFRDDVRRFWRGDPGLVSALATRLTGSSDLYADDGRKPFHSVNYITAHDGFTLNDMVTYNDKHNFLNGENGRDGSDNNNSYNYGVEGETRDEDILEIRNRQVKNFLATLVLSVGTPMFLGGDEIRRTQLGNNNAYCQDSAISWLDYTNADRHPDVIRFVKCLTALRKEHHVFRRPEFFTGRDNNSDSFADISWFNELGQPVDWGRSEGLLALRLDGKVAETQHHRDDNDFFIMVNATLFDQLFTVPKAAGKERWHRCLDSALAAPGDFCEHGKEVPVDHEQKYLLQSRSMVVLLSR